MVAPPRLDTILFTFQICLSLTPPHQFFIVFLGPFSKNPKYLSSYKSNLVLEPTIVKKTHKRTRENHFFSRSYCMFVEP